MMTQMNIIHHNVDFVVAKTGITYHIQSMHAVVMSLIQLNMDQVHQTV